MKRKFKSKPTVQNKSLRIKISQILSKNLQKLILSSWKSLRKRRINQISTFAQIKRQFKSKPTVNNKSLRIKIPQILLKNLQKLVLSSWKSLRKRRLNQISTFAQIKRQFKSKPTVNNKSLRIRIPQILLKNLQNLVLSLENLCASVESIRSRPSFRLERQFKSKPTVNNKSLRIRIPQILSKNL